MGVPVEPESSPVTPLRLELETAKKTPGYK